MEIKKATNKYEAWLAKRTAIVEADLAFKHTQMAAGPFSFLRATFYRWMQVWPQVCSTLETAPGVLAVGDLHVENFGTWRDAEGRLIWGINDFDEVSLLPYAVDLVRLATSAHLAITANHLAMNPKEACDSILEGYAEGLEKGGCPFVLAEQHSWLRSVALSELRDPVRFWQKMDGLPTVKGTIPASAKEAIEHLMPERGLAYRVVHRVAGLGSLGRQRFMGIADWHGGKVAREAKALVPSACIWARNDQGPTEILYQAILSPAVRCSDPFVQLRGRWVVRRLAPDCCRIELASLPAKRDESRLLHAMGWEAANVHLGSKNAINAVRRDLKKRPAGWLRAASKKMMKATISDWEDWKRLVA
jgi:uncharacterized protein (DUF2252 family)